MPTLGSRLSNAEIAEVVAPAIAAVKLDDLAAPDDTTDLNASLTAHGLLPKLPGGTTTFLRADGTFAAPPAGGSPAWGDVSGTLTNQTDLQGALDAKAASGHSHGGTYEPADAAIQSHLASTSNPHGVTKAQVGLGSASDTADADKPVSTATQAAPDAKAASSHTHTGVYEAANANLQSHVGSAHAPSTAQANADITKAEIEAKLTGEISSHSHAGGGGSPWTFLGATASDISTGANTTPVNLTGLVFTYAASSVYLIELVGATRAALTTTGNRFALNVSSAVTRVGLMIAQQLANTGTLTGAQSIADDASAGTTSGRPTANVDTPVLGQGYLVTGAGQSGTAQLRFISETTAVATCMAGFILRVTKVS